jgi:hypothetical protein
MLFKEIKCGSPKLSREQAIRLAADYVRSGKALPQSRLAGPGTQLIKSLHEVLGYRFTVAIG